jgi:hypothetical protein
MMLRKITWNLPVDSKIYNDYYIFLLGDLL